MLAPEDVTKVWASVMGAAEDDVAAEPLGRVLLSLKQRFLGERAVVDENTRLWEERRLQAAFREKSRWPSLQFDCSMLQTMVERADGTVAWREVRCGRDRDARPKLG